MLGQYSGEIEGLSRAAEYRKLLRNIELNSYIFLFLLIFYFRKILIFKCESYRIIRSVL